MLPRSCRVVPGLQLHCSGKDSWGLVLAQMKKKKKLEEKRKPPSEKENFTRRAPRPAPRCGGEAAPAREERGASANCSFVRFRVWEAAVRALISAAHYPG